MAWLVPALWGAGSDLDAFDFEALDLEGKAFSGRSLEGRLVLMDFWAVWCGPCIKAFPLLSRLHQEFSEKGFQVLGVAVHSGSAPEVKAFLEEHPVSYPVVVGDEEITYRFQVIGFPTYLLVGPDGTILKRYVGGMEDLYSTLSAEIRTILDETTEKKSRR